MVIVRESPRAKLSPSKDGTQWPPRSPFQALLSSPSGRKKWQDRTDRSGARTPSLSPSRVPLDSVRAAQTLSAESEDEVGEEEDEETLFLKLQAIQAKLKLKKLQKSRQEGSERSSKENSIGFLSRDEATVRSPTKLSRLTTIPPPRTHGPAVEVPLSPMRQNVHPVDHISPARKRVGLESKRSAESVSLKRARDGTQSQRSDARSRRTDEDAFDEQKPSSFSDRLARSRVEVQDKQAKQERLERVRSKAFDSKRPSTVSTQLPSGSENRNPPVVKSRGQTPDRSSIKPGGGEVRKTNSGRASTKSQVSSRVNDVYIPGSGSRAKPRQHLPDSESGSSPYLYRQDSASTGYDAFSQIHLSKRNVEHAVVAREMEGKEIYTLPRLLKEVRAPDYEPPDCESDFVVFAILASKSNPFDQKAAHHTSDANKPQEDVNAPRNKFMVFHLTDLKWEVNCFLFGTAFDQFWKLTPGTLLAILNPSIMPPKTNQHSGNFSLKLGSSEDCVMEIGTARDLGYCASVKKDGQVCSEWIDKRNAKICEFHLNLMIDRNRKHRMEVNSMWRDGGNKNGRANSHSMAAGGFDDLLKDKKKPSRGNYHHEYGRLYSVPSNFAKSAASLLDAEDTDALHNMTQEEASRKRIASAQRERDLAKKLSDIGTSVGGEYFRHRQTEITTTSSTARQESSQTNGDFFEKPSASELGLLGKKASDQHLSPGKDRKYHFGLGAVSVTRGTKAMGWGGAFKPGLLRPKENKMSSPERGQKDLDVVAAASKRSAVRDASLSPTKKRARFALARGVRTPGRDSAGEEMRDSVAWGDEDEDGLDIV